MPKLEPRTVRTVLPVDGAFARRMRVIMGESKVKTRAMVPTCLLIVTATRRSFPLPDGVVQMSLVMLDHSLVPHTSLPIWTVAVTSERPKFTPNTVICTPPDVAPLIAVSSVISGASYV